MIDWLNEQPLEFKAVLVVLGSLILAFLLWRLWLRQYLEWRNVKSLEIEKRVGLKIEFIKTAAQVLGGLFFLVTIYIAWANLKVSQEKHTTDLYVQAIKQLGDTKLEVRLGGIYALERIARDSEKDHGPIMEVFTAYVRENAPWRPTKSLIVNEQSHPGRKQRDQWLVWPNAGKSKSTTEIYSGPRPDIQAILTVIGRRKPTYGKGETRGLFLHYVDLERVYLWKANLEGAILIGANLEEIFLNETLLKGAHLTAANLQSAELDKAYLQKVDLKGANLTWAYLIEAHMEGANLKGATLYGADLREAILDGAILEGANLQYADLRKARGLKEDQVRNARNWILAYLPENMLEKLSLPQDHNQRLAENNLSGYRLVDMDLSWANLNGFNLQGAVFNRARLGGAYLAGADLSEAKGLTKEQIASAFTDETTKLPDYLKTADRDKAKPQ